VEATGPEAKAFEALRPSQRKLAYTLYRAALSAHELGYYRSHPRAVEVREALAALLQARVNLPEKAQAPLGAVEVYLEQVRANHGLYDATGKKLCLGGTWKDLQQAAQGAARTGPKDLPARLQKLKGLLFDPKVDAVAPSWAEAASPAKGKKGKAMKGPVAPEGFAQQKALTAGWVKQARYWVEDTPQERLVKGEKKLQRWPDPAQTKVLNDLLAWFDKDDLALLRDPGFGWLDVRRLGADPGAGLLAHATDITASKAPEGPAGDLVLLATFEVSQAPSKFSKGEDKHEVLAEVRMGPPAATLADQMVAIEKLGRSRELEIK
jgi:hypothetical protein